MTCIVGLVDEHSGAVVIGGDSAGVAGYSLTVRADTKVFRNGLFLIGGTTSFRMLQLLCYAFKPPMLTVGQDVMEYLCTIWIDAVRKCFQDGGFARKNNEAETGGAFLVGCRGRLFTIDNDYQVGEAACGYDAVGCGDEIARGSLHTSISLGGVSAEGHVRLALEAAETHSAGVRGPFTILTLSANEPEPAPLTVLASHQNGHSQDDMWTILGEAYTRQ